MKTVVIGLGNPYFGNDSAGIKVAEMVEMSGDIPNTDVVYLSTTSFEVIDKILGYDRAFIIDTIRGEKPGRIHVFDVFCVDDLIDELDKMTGNREANRQLHRQSRRYASHAMGLTETLRVGYELFPDEMPDVGVIAIEITDAEPGTGCSREVEEAVERAFRLLLKKIAGENSPSLPSSRKS